MTDKSRHKIKAYKLQSQYPSDTGPSSGVTIRQIIDEEWESIQSSNGRHKSNHCTHLRCRVQHKTVDYTNKEQTFSGPTLYTAESLRLFGGWIDGPVAGPYSLGKSPSIGEIEKRFKGVDSPPQLLNFFAELASMKTLVNGAIGALKGLNPSALLKSQPPGLRKSARSASQRYLEYNFGIAPAVSDALKAIDSARKMGDRLVELLSNSYTQKPEVFTWSEKEQYKYTVDLSESLCETKVEYKVSNTIQQFIAAKYELAESSNLQSLLYFISGLGLDNVVSATYEAIPFSFILDWFLPIGDFLEGIEPDIFQFQSFTILEHYAQVHQEVTFVQKVLEDNYTTDKLLTGKTVTVGKCKNFFRHVDLPVPIQSIGPGSGLSSGKTTSLAALAGARLR